MDVASVDSIAVPPVDSQTDLVARAREDDRTQPASRPALLAIAGAAAFVAVAVALPVLANGHQPLRLAPVLALVIAFALVAQVRFEIGGGFAMPTQLIFVPMALAVPARWLPAVVAIAYLLAAAPQLVRPSTSLARAVPLTLLSSWYALGPAVVLTAAGDPHAGWRHWPVYLAALAAQFCVDYVIGAAWEKGAYGVSFEQHVHEAALPWLVDLALAPLGLSIGLRVADHPFAVLLVLPLVGLLGYFARERRHRLDHAIELSHAYRGTAFLLGDVIEADDAYTGSHSRAVVELTLAVCDGLGLDAETRRDSELAALLHDVGKVRIPAAVINKPGPLDADERALMDTHTIEGERMLEQVGGLLGHVGRIVRSCHEHWDGSGYPDALAGEAIPVAARIVACCDAYHAMTSDRPYRRALAPEDAKDELRRGRGTQFDPQVVDALLRVA